MNYRCKVRINGTEDGGIPERIGEQSENGLRTTDYRIPLITAPGARLILHEMREERTGAVRCALELSAGCEEKLEVGGFEIGFLCDSFGTLHDFKADWGKEFEPEEQPVAQGREIVLEVTAGRSSKGFAPWAGFSGDGEFWSVAVGWPGNWRLRARREGAGTLIGAGLSDAHFGKTLGPGETLSGFVLYAASSAQDLEEACGRLRRFFLERVSLMGARDWDTLPVTYNTWWCYEDKFLSEEACLKNAEIARETGMTHFMLDAGWFGDSREGADWVGTRGDWDIVNSRFFPGGIRRLGAQINGKGIRFGIWCEIEAVGEKARLREEHPEFVARRDGKSLGYVCMSSPNVRAWALGQIVRLIEEYGAHWIKFDFNLDPGFGCGAEGHAHGERDGLFEHYRGYYRLLSEIHRLYPQVILENCSSGGLRLDLGMLEHTHFTFLSDPDYVEHHFQCFWGAVSYLPAACCFHFTQSECLGDHNGVKNPISADMPAHRFDTIIRSGLLCVPGFSYRLDQWPAWCLQRLREHIAFFREISKKYILEGELFRLTGQALRGGVGDRWQAYEYLAGDGGALVFLFRLDGADSDSERTIRLRGLNREAVYRVEWTDGRRSERMSGKELMEQGLPARGLEQGASEIIRLHAGTSGGSETETMA